MLIRKALPDKRTAISIADCMPPNVYRNQRINIHKTLKGIARCCKFPMSLFLSYKSHMICYKKGGLPEFMMTPGDTDYRKSSDIKTLRTFLETLPLITCFPKKRFINVRKSIDTYFCFIPGTMGSRYNQTRLNA